eukprot:15349217-Ditylum_brightwellii.AAC.1
MVKQDTKKEYLNCTYSILKVDLTSDATMAAICAYVVPHPPPLLTLLHGRLGPYKHYGDTLPQVYSPANL